MKRNDKKKNAYASVWILLVLLGLVGVGIYFRMEDIKDIFYKVEVLLNYSAGVTAQQEESEEGNPSDNSIGYEADEILANIPEFDGMPYVELNGNVPAFDVEAYKIETFEEYSELDSLGRCGVAFALVGKEIMPVEERGEIGSIKPTGWHTVKYDVVEDRYLYNRCHLIGYQLTGENANEKNLITGTRYMNIEGMLPFENEVGSYVRRTGNHVLYRVTPVFAGENLVASGVQMEAWSVEDEGEGICFNVFVYNCQPGVEIDYLTGESRLK